MSGGVSHRTTAAFPREFRLAQPSPSDRQSSSFPGLHRCTTAFAEGGAGKSGGDWPCSWFLSVNLKKGKSKVLRIKISLLLFHVYLPNKEHLGKEWQLIFSIREIGG